jgi:drug/metabolite transporter (DMT)-like permease
MITHSAALYLAAVLIWGSSWFAIKFQLGTDAPLNYDPSLDYTLSLLYLSIFASVLAFGSYLTLLGRIGADRAAYATVLFPVVALLLSTFFEGYRWSATSLTGVSLVLLGNLIVVTNAQVRARFVGALRKAFHSAS